MKNRLLLLLTAMMVAVVSLKAETSNVRIETPRYITKTVEASKDGLTYSSGHFYRLDTRTGQVAVVHWNPVVAKTKITILEGTPDIDETTSYDGRFILDIYSISIGSFTLILLDSETGDIYQCSSKRSDTFTKIL